MSLKIYCASRLECLAEKLKVCLLADRQGADPFVFTKIVVPNGNVAKWLQLRKFATEPCLCAGIEFPFMEKRLAELLKEGLPPDERTDVELLPDHAYARAIVSILLEKPEAQSEYGMFAPFRRYVMNTESGEGSITLTDRKQAAMIWQLADKLADLMDAYEVHRPEIVDAWLGIGTCPYALPAGETAAAEAALARALWGESGWFKPNGNHLSLRQLYNRVKDGSSLGNPQKVYFFGQSTLSYLQVQILAWLARTHEVVVFHHNLCQEYWGDITTRKEDCQWLRGMKVFGNDPEADNAFSCENELLKTLGTAGRETLRLLVNLEEANGADDPARRFEFSWKSLDGEGRSPKTVLGKMQEAVRRRTSEVEAIPQDASVQVVGTPGLRREVEMVYNSILGSVARPKGVTGERPWPDCSFSDIAVIVPDMKTYRPMIENVFDARGEVPYALLDTSARDGSHYLRGFLGLIELGRKGLNRERLFNVLENPCVQRALGFARADVVAWRELTEKIGAFDGFEHDPEDGYFDWSSALRRIRLARIADAVVENGDDLPLVLEGGEGALKLSEVVELISRDLTNTLYDEAGKARVLPLVASRQEDGSRSDCWAERLARLAKIYLEIDKDDKLDGKVRQSVIGTLYSLGDISRPLNFEPAVAAVEYFVGGIACAKGKYLTSGVTIGNFSSLSALPFKQVYLVGMGAGGFPGRTHSSTLDLRGAGWRLGDVSAPNQNRFLFLEALMSVRDRLVVSYPNRDIEKDAELFPSGLVREVEKFLGNHVLAYGKEEEEDKRTFREFRGYPLLERGESGPRKADEKRPTDDIIWRKDDPYAGILPTYSRAARRLARARTEGQDHQTDDKEDVSQNKAQSRIEISAKVLAEFLKNPVRAVMRYRFGIAVAGYLETDLEPDSPLGTLGYLDDLNLQAKWLELNPSSVEKAFRGLQLSGKMPTGFLGAFAKDTILKDAATRIGAVSEFVKGYSLSDGRENALHLDFATELGFAGTTKLKVRLSADVPNWKEEVGVVSVLVASKLDDEAAKKAKKGAEPKPPKLQLVPGLCCSLSFIAYLMRRVQMPSEELSLRVGVVDFKDGKTGTWLWKIDARSAETYLTRLVTAYLESAQCEKMLDLDGKKLLKVRSEFDKEDDVDWATVFEKLTAEESSYFQSTFNNDLVIEQNLAPYQCEPKESELKTIYENRYRLLCEGVRLEAEEGEVDHE